MDRPASMLCAGIVLGALLSEGTLAQGAPPPPIAARSYLLMDFSTGQVLAESRAQTRLAPASLTKLMTAYVVFTALRQGIIRLEDPVHVSEAAWRKPGSRMFIEVNTRVVVEDLVRGMIIQSGNDASVALAEHIGGSEQSFVYLMNRHAQALGLSDSAFRNVTGLPAEGHHSTAYDMALLVRALIEEFPQYYHFYAERQFTYNGITQHNRNSLLWRDPSVDGLKTGYTASAGYCLVSSATRSGMRLIAVVMGTENDKARDSGSQALLDYGFETFETRSLYSGGEEIAAARIWNGEPQTAALGLSEDLYVVIPRGQYSDLSAVMHLPSRLVAPLPAQAPVGEVRISMQGRQLASAPVVVLEPVGEGSYWRRFTARLSSWLE